jgi:hypothetical protein
MCRRFCSVGYRALDRDRIAIHTTKLSSFKKATGRVVNGQEFETGAGDILVIKAGEIHSFKNTGETPLVQLDVHLSPRFIQENL